MNRYILPLLIANFGTTIMAATHNYAEALQKSLYFFDSQYSGVKPSWSTCNWCGDMHTRDGQDVGLDLTGGFRDCGDGVMFGLPSFFSTSLLGWTMLEYKSAFDTATVYQHALDVMKHQTDFIIKAHPHPNVLYGQKGFGSSDHEVWVPYEYGTTDRPSWQVNASCPGSDLAGQASATMSVAYLLFKRKNITYANLLLEHSKQLFDFSTTYEGKYSDCITDAKGYYNSGGYADEQLWASIWLYKATGVQKYKDYAISNSRVFVKDFMCWSLAWDTAAVGNMHLLCKMFKDKDACYQVENYLEYWAASGLSNGGSVQRTPGGLAFLSAWGVLRHANVMSFMSLLYVDTTPDLVIDKAVRYVAFAKSQYDYVLGSNPLNLSYLVGYGARWPQRTHHRNAHGSTLNDMAQPDKNRHVNWMIGGGPNMKDEYPDERSDYVLSESGMDFQASFISGIAAMTKRFKGKPLLNFPRPERRGIEYYVNASFQQQSAQSAQGTFFFVGQTGWPPRSRDVMFRVFFKTGIPNLRTTSYYNQNATISIVKQCNANLDHVNVSFGAGFIYPGSTISSIKQTQITFSTSAAKLNLSSNWSLHQVLQIARDIPVYEKVRGKWVLQFGIEPNCTYPTTSNSSSSSTPSIPPENCKNREWEQCDGLQFTGDRCCAVGLKCVIINEYYGQCQK